MSRTQPASKYSSPVAPTINFTVPDSTGSGGSSTYGLSTQAGAYKFDLTGLATLGAGPTTGTDLLNAFVASGSGRGDPAIVAAIQQALALAGFYTSSFTPTPGRVLPQDAQALSKALNQLAIANASSPQGNGAPTMGVSQFLVQAAAAGAANGQGAAQRVTVYTRPDPVLAAQHYEKTVQSMTGHKPTPAETQDFVDYWTNKSLQEQKDAAESQTQATVNPSVSPLTPAPSLNAQPILHPPNQEARLDTSPDYGAPPPLDASMASLSDVINGATGGAPPSIEQAAPSDLDSTAENYVKEHSGNAVATHDLGGALGQFLQLISGNGGA